MAKAILPDTFNLPAMNAWNEKEKKKRNLEQIYNYHLLIPQCMYLLSHISWSHNCNKEKFSGCYSNMFSYL